MMSFKLLKIWKIETLQDQLPDDILFNGGDGIILCIAGEWDLITEYYYKNINIYLLVVLHQDL